MYPMCPVRRCHGVPPMPIRMSFPCETTHDDIRIPLPNGTRPHVRAWRLLTEVAALAPEPLKAVATVRSMDDHYDNDVHRPGGSVLAAGTHAWGPHCSPSWTCALAHPTRDDYGQRAPVRTDCGAIRAAAPTAGG